MPNQAFEGYYRLPWIPPNNIQPHHAQKEHTHDHHQEWDGYIPGLRGGCLSSGDEEDSLMGDDVDDDAEALSVATDTSMKDTHGASGNNHDSRLFLRGGADTDSDIDYYYDSDDDGDIVTLYGFSGRQVCKIDQPTSLMRAMDNLFALQDRQDINGGGIPVTVAFLVANNEDKDERFGVCRQVVHGHIGQGAQREQALYAAVRGVRSQLDTTSLRDINLKVVLFVCYQFQDRRFREGIGRSVAFQPDVHDDSCINLYLASAGRDNTVGNSPRAYLWKPVNVNEKVSSHLYEEWFSAVYQTLTGSQGYAYRLGLVKAAPPHHGLLTIKGVQFHSQMPLPREVWAWMVVQFNADNRQLSITRDELDDIAYCSVPGYAKHRSVQNTDDVFALAWESVPQEERATVNRIDIRPWDVPFDAAEPDVASFRCRGGHVHPSHRLYAENIAQLNQLLGQRRVLMIQPRWREYSAHILNDQGVELSTVTLSARQIADDWPRTLSVMKAEFDKAGRWQDNAVVRISQGNQLSYNAARNSASESAQQLEYQLRNRTNWDFEPVASHEMSEFWRRFAHLVSLNDLEVRLVPKVDADGNPSFGDPLGLRRNDPERWPWGYNAPQFKRLDEPDIEMGYEPINPAGPETQHEQDVRAISFEPPDIEKMDLDDIGSARVSLQRDQWPNRQPLDLAQRGKAFREWSYGLPLSTNMTNQHPEIPINAPPLEHLFKQRGPDGLASTSLPVMSTQVLTPTEQRRLQESFFHMRSIALNRGQMCPHKGCMAYFPVDPDNMEKFHTHLERNHVGTHCPFCPETLFSHWPPEQRRRHFVDRHSEYFTKRDDLLMEARLADNIVSKGLVHRREELYNYCPRCGRNHNVLNSKADRTQHDNVCFPSNTTRDANMTYCRSCGGPELIGSGAPGDPWLAHVCRVTASDAFCKKCALPCSKLGMSYARRHLLHCKPRDTGRDNWCPWCGIDLKSGPRSQRLRHLEDCGLRPFNGENPVCTETGDPMESPRDNPEPLHHSSVEPTAAEGHERLLIPDVCSIADCQQDLTLLNAHGLYVHFMRIHTEGTKGMTHCPFCRVDFVARGWTIQAEKEAHLQNHMDHHYERITADETISASHDWENQEVRDASASARQDHTQVDPAARGAELQHQTAALTEENQKLRQAGGPGSGTSGPGR